MTRAAKRIFITAVTTAMLLVLAFAATVTDAGAALKPLEKGQYFKAGYCIRPGEGYGPNAGYEVMDVGDSFMYNNEYISTTGNPGSGGRWNGDPGDPMYTQPVNVTYALMEKRYIGYPNGMRGDYYLPDGYLEYGAYCFKLMPESITSIRIPYTTTSRTGENRGAFRSLRATERRSIRSISGSCSQNRTASTSTRAETGPWT